MSASGRISSTIRRGACLAMVLTLGCQSKIANYTPAVAVAEDAMRKTLDAWKAGLPAGEIAGSKPVIQVVDVGRKTGQSLEDYRILGETKCPSGRTFVVALDLRNPDESIKTKYIVVGIDPLWVFRQEDYELLSHWDHHMPPEPAKTGQAESAGTESP